MENAVTDKDFNIKFKKLNKQNQKYILAIEQAMLFAQDSGGGEQHDNENQQNE